MLPPPVKRIARVNAPDQVAPPPARRVVPDSEMDSPWDNEVFDAPMPTSTDSWKTEPRISIYDDEPGGYVNFDNLPTQPRVANIVGGPGVHLPNLNSEPLPDPRRMAGRVSGGLVHSPVIEPAAQPSVAQTRLSITPATAVALGAGALGLGYGASQMMSDDEASGEELSRLYLQNKMNQALLDRAVGSGLVNKG